MCLPVRGHCLHTLINISKHRLEQSDGLWITAALPSILKLIVTEYSERIVTEQMTSFIAHFVTIYCLH